MQEDLAQRTQIAHSSIQEILSANLADIPLILEANRLRRRPKPKYYTVSAAELMPGEKIDLPIPYRTLGREKIIAFTDDAGRRWGRSMKSGKYLSPRTLARYANRVWYLSGTLSEPRDSRKK
jgi:hypothetical protein